MGARLSVKISSSLDRELEARAAARAMSKADIVWEILCRHVLSARSVEMQETRIESRNFKSRRAAT